VRTALQLEHVYLPIYLDNRGCAALARRALLHLVPPDAREEYLDNPDGKPTVRPCRPAHIRSPAACAGPVGRRRSDGGAGSGAPAAWPPPGVRCRPGCWCRSAAVQVRRAPTWGAPGECGRPGASVAVNVAGR